MYFPLLLSSFNYCFLPSGLSSLILECCCVVNSSPKIFQRYLLNMNAEVFRQDFSLDEEFGFVSLALDSATEKRLLFSMRSFSMRSMARLLLSSSREGLEVI